MKTRNNNKKKTGYSPKGHTFVFVPGYLIVCSERLVYFVHAEVRVSGGQDESHQ
jgi:hypothetical protein